MAAIQVKKVVPAVTVLSASADKGYVRVRKGRLFKLHATDSISDGRDMFRWLPMDASIKRLGGKFNTLADALNHALDKGDKVWQVAGLADLQDLVCPDEDGDACVDEDEGDDQGSY